MASKREEVSLPGVAHDAPIPMAAKIGNYLFTSAVMGREPADNSLPPEPERQAKLLFDNIRKLMQAAGGSPDDIGHMTFFLTSNDYREHLNREWLKMFPDEHDRPARHVLVWDLPRGMLIQAEIKAVLS